MDTSSEIDKYVNASYDAFVEFRKYNVKQRVALMYGIADAIENLGQDLIETAHKETHLPIARLTGEKGRTVFQWRSYAKALESGTVLEVRIDTAQPTKTPPRLDIRKSYQGLGPVVVFGASNFPFAFSTAGGDTASAIAAGCTVLVKAHEGHPETAKLMASAVQEAVIKAGFHPATFQQIFCSTHVESQELIKHPKVKAVGFTGSFRGGKALFDAAAQRAEPIPVFAEMGSVNPVFVLPEKAKNAGKEIAEKYVASLTLGVGQFCTNPGLLFIPENSNALLMTLVEEINKVPAAEMLHQGIAVAYHEGRERMEKQKDTETLFSAVPESATMGSPALVKVSSSTFLKNTNLHKEVFGPFGIVITYKELSELKVIIASLEGQLTATVWAEEDELQTFKDDLDALAEKCGRLLFNGFPTGVEVVTAMQHGGPFPASTDSRFTSVGADAIKRFARPVCYQNLPDSLLPEELKNANPLGIYRLVDEEITREAI